MVRFVGCVGLATFLAPGPRGTYGLVQLAAKSAANWPQNIKIRSPQNIKNTQIFPITNRLSSMLLATGFQLFRIPPPQSGCGIIAISRWLRKGSWFFCLFYNASMAGFTLLSPNSRSSY